MRNAKPRTPKARPLAEELKLPSWAHTAVIAAKVMPVAVNVRPYRTAWLNSVPSSPRTENMISAPRASAAITASHRAAARSARRPTGWERTTSEREAPRQRG